VNRIRSVVKQVIVQLTITRSKLLLLQEQRIVHERERVEHVKVVTLREDESVVDQLVQPLLEQYAILGLAEPGLGGIIEEVGCFDGGVFGGLDDGGFQAVEGKEVGNFSGRGLRLLETLR